MAGTFAVCDGATAAGFAVDGTETGSDVFALVGTLLSGDTVRGDVLTGGTLATEGDAGMEGAG